MDTGGHTYKGFYGVQYVDHTALGFLSSVKLVPDCSQCVIKNLITMFNVVRPERSSTFLKRYSLWFCLFSRDEVHKHLDPLLFFVVLADADCAGGAFDHARAGSWRGYLTRRYQRCRLARTALCSHCEIRVRGKSHDPSPGHTFSACCDSAACQISAEAPHFRKSVPHALPVEPMNNPSPGTYQKVLLHTNGISAMW